MPRSAPSLAEFLAARLCAESEDVLEEWLGWMRERIGTRAIRALPDGALRSHIPQVLDSLALYLTTPIEALRSATIGHLRLHAQLRRDQGYDIQELLVEFEYLASIVTRRLAAALPDHAGAEPTEVARVFNLLNTGLRSMAFVMVGMYREREAELSRELSKRLEEFASAFVHEIRQPLNTIALGAILLGSDRVAGDPAARKKHRDAIEQALARTGNLIEDIRMLARAEGARAEPSWSALEGIVRQVLVEVGAAASNAHVALRLEEPVPDVEVDDMCLHLVLLNLVGNAIEFHDPKERERWVAVEVAWESGADETLGTCTVRVRDNGLGIPPDAKDHVFERHFRAHPERADGLGLGLSLALHAAGQAGGSLVLETTSPEGSTFVVRLPARAMQADRPSSIDPVEIARQSVDGLGELGRDDP